MLGKISPEVLQLFTGNLGAVQTDLGEKPDIEQLLLENWEILF